MILKFMSRFWSGNISLPLTKPCVHFRLLTIVCDALLVNCPNWPLIQMGTVMQLPTSQCDNIVWVEKPSSRLNPSLRRTNSPLLFKTHLDPTTFLKMEYFRFVPPTLLAISTVVVAMPSKMYLIVDV